MTVKFKTVITKAGAEKLAAATVPNGKKVNFTAMAVGDGGGALPVPDASQTKLVNEVWRHALNKISQDKKNKNYVVAELLIPPEVGGFWMREMGLYDDTGTLIAVGNMAESYKPALEEGSGRAQTLRMVIMVSDISSVELTIDTSTVMATQEYVDGKLAEHEQSRRHPDATLAAKGFTQLSSAIDSASEVLAATPKAVKAAYDLANGKYTAADATTARKGIVQLSSATDSVSEVLAATPKAVKTAYDLANAKYTAVDATTARKGLVQLSSATNSLSEALAATPKGVSTAVKELKDTLGSSANADVVSSMVDVTTGRVPMVGWMGLGGIRDTKIANENMASFWRDTSIVKAGITIPYDGSPTVSYFAIDGANQHAYVGRKPPGGTISWVRLYSEFNKPTASDVDAVSASQGGTFQREVTFNQGLSSRGRITFGDYSRAVGSSTYNAMMNVSDSTGKTRWAFGPYENSWSIYAYNADGSYKGNVVNIDFTTFNASFAAQVIPNNYANFDARYLQQAGGTITGNLAINNNAPIITFSEADTGKKYFIVADGSGFRINEDSTAGNFVLSYLGGSKQLKTVGQFVPGDWANFDARYQAKGSYTPAGQAYTKAESDARYQLKNTASRATNGWFKDASTGMIFQWGTITLPASGNRTTSAAFSFPMTFPNAALNLQTTPASVGVSNNGYLAVTAVTSLSASGGTIYADSNNGESFSKTQTVRYYAVGY
ncbi:phage tail protein [Enterobacter cloacae]|uniref:phage tail-collar fiber domain-containing protein n=1 Tax=Enterobacter cloacae TaxID=550 RepID=UPI0021D062CF|nr:phage tail protein [Enterobacter cloacae]MCU6227622.1 phage tail protein [Enterobacter cloacae]